MSNRLPRFSVPNPVNGDEGNDDDHPNSPASPAAGVKKDLSVLSQTFSRRLRGVSDFLAPPPTPSSQLSHQAPKAAIFCGGPRSPSSRAITGIKNDLSEIGGTFKSLLSSSSKVAAAGISKFARYFLQFPDGGCDEEDDYRELEDVPGIDEKVVGFAREVSLRPELWSDFPLSLPSDFNMSETQKEHAATIEQLVTDIAILRQNFCSHLSYGQFWMIYFVLLLPSLDDTSKELLSSTEIVQVRETLLQNLLDKRNPQVGISESQISNASGADNRVNITQGDNTFSQKNDNSPNKVDTGREVQEAGSSENREVGPDRTNAYNEKQCEKVEDVSFSDLENEYNDISDRLSARNLIHGGRVSSGSESSGWVGVQAFDPKGRLSTTKQDRHSESEESSDWFRVDDVDSDSFSVV